MELGSLRDAGRRFLIQCRYYLFSKRVNCAKGMVLGIPMVLRAWAHERPGVIKLAMAGTQDW